MLRRDALRLALLSAALLLPPAGAAAQGFAAAPFHERPEAVLRTATLHVIAAKRAALLAGPDDDIAESLPGDATLLLGSLAAADPDAARALDAAVSAAQDDPAALGDALAAARSALTSGSDPALAAAVASWLLVSEAGLAEAYEEAVEGEDGMYALGHALLGEVEVLVTPLLAAMRAEGQTAAREPLGALRALMPGPEAPARLSPDPEEAEGHAHALVAVLEHELDADLVPGRDLGRAVGTLDDLVRAGCEAPDTALGRERLAIAARFHESALADPLSVLAPEAAEGAGRAFAALAGSSADDDAAAPLPDSGAAACADLAAALVAAGGIFGRSTQ